MFSTVPCDSYNPGLTVYIILYNNIWTYIFVYEICPYINTYKTSKFAKYEDDAWTYFLVQENQANSPKEYNTAINK